MKLSIIIPTYKKPQSLLRCLRSVTKHCKGAEVIIVVDDMSKCDDLKEEFDRFTFTSLGNGTGLTMAIWKGALISSGNIIGFIGDDVEFTMPMTDDILLWQAAKYPLDSVFGLNDGINQGRAHPFMYREYGLSGGLYPPCYKHFFGDTEIYKTAKHYDRWVFLEGLKVLHHHEYPKKLGYEGINILEDTTEHNRSISGNDSTIFKNRMKWWEENGNPRTIPYSIGVNIKE